MLDEFIEKDFYTGRKIRNPLNKKELSDWEMDELFIGDYE